jgi:hypothetical protein
VAWKIAVVFLVGSVLCCYGGCQAFKQFFAGMDPNYWSPQQIAERETSIRSRGPVERSAQDVEAAMTSAADRIKALVPGMSWRWADEASRTSQCDVYGIFHDIKPVYVDLRQLQFDRIIPDETLGRAVDVLQDEAQALRITGRKDTFTDYRGRSYTMFEDANERYIALVEAKVAVGDQSTKAFSLEGRSDCLFPERYFAEHNIPTPAPTTTASR